MARRLDATQLDAKPQEKGPFDFSYWIQVDLDALEHNLKLIQSHSQVPLLPILKADAYGHGAPVLAAFLQSRGYSLFGVSSLEEALGILQITQTPLLLLTPPLPGQLPLVVKHGLIPTVTSPAIIAHLARIAKDQRKRVTVHIKVDTGFGRLGVAPEEVLSLVQQIKKTPFLELGGVFTHFSVAFSDHRFTQEQLLRLIALKRQLTVSVGDEKVLWHAANSAAFLTLPESHLDLVRVGTLLYGQSPVSCDLSWDLRDTWQFKARIIQIRTLPKGHGVGYGRMFRTTKPTRIGVIPVGYSHGLELEPQGTPWRQIKQALGRSIKDRHFVFQANHPLPIIGRVGMGLSCVDLGHRPELNVGDEVTIVMRRVTASGHVPRLYYLNGILKCVFWNHRVFSQGMWKTNSRGLFSQEFPLHP